MKVWTFEITGGEPCVLQLPNTPTLNHTGDKTLWKMVGTSVLALAVETMLLASGADVILRTEFQTPEQTLMRQQRLGKI